VKSSKSHEPFFHHEKCSTAKIHYKRDLKIPDDEFHVFMIIEAQRHSNSFNLERTQRNTKSTLFHKIWSNILFQQSTVTLVTTKKTFIKGNK
jgi:hypothetical protein